MTGSEGKLQAQVPVSATCRIGMKNKTGTKSGTLNLNLRMKRNRMSHSMAFWFSPPVSPFSTTTILMNELILIHIDIFIHKVHVYPRSSFFQGEINMSQWPVHE